MRAQHSTHSLPAFPVYSSAFLSPGQLVLGGGGGASRSGIKNKLRLYHVKDDRTVDLQAEYELEKGEDAPMSMAAHTEGNTLVCGVNSTLDKLEKGDNENCRVFHVKDNEITLLGSQGTISTSDGEDYQKVTVLSPDGTLLAVAGAYDLSLLSYPSLVPVADPVHTTKEIYDATFSGNTLVVATTLNLLVYALPDISARTSPSKGKGKKKSKSKDTNEKVTALQLKETVGLPTATGGAAGSTFRAARYHPLNDKVLYTVINASAPRSRSSKSIARQAYVCRWNTTSWTVEKSRKVGEKGLTCFDVSTDGRFLGFGSSDLTIGILDATSLAPLVTILKAHEFPPTTIKFNSSTTLLVSGSADNSIRVVTVPEMAGGFSAKSWTFILMLLVLILAIIAQNYLGSSLKW